MHEHCWASLNIQGSWMQWFEFLWINADTYFYTGFHIILFLRAFCWELRRLGRLEKGERREKGSGSQNKRTCSCSGRCAGWTAKRCAWRSAGWCYIGCTGLSSCGSSAWWTELCWAWCRRAGGYWAWWGWNHSRHSRGKAGVHHWYWTWKCIASWWGRARGCLSACSGTRWARCARSSWTSPNISRVSWSRRPRWTRWSWHSIRSSKVSWGTRWSWPSIRSSWISWRSRSARRTRTTWGTRDSRRRGHCMYLLTILCTCQTDKFLEHISRYSKCATMGFLHYKYTAGMAFDSHKCWTVNENSSQVRSVWWYI